MDRLLDLDYLTERELEIILEVLCRDEEIMKREEARIRRLRSKAIKTNNPIIHKKIKMRTGEWFREIAETRTGIKRYNTASMTVRASIRGSRRKAKSITKPVGPPIIEVSLSESVDSDYHSLHQIPTTSHEAERIHATQGYHSSSSSSEEDIKVYKPPKSKFPVGNGSATILYDDQPPTSFDVEVNIAKVSAIEQTHSPAGGAVEAASSESHEDQKSSDSENESIGGFKLMGLKKTSRAGLDEVVDLQKNAIATEAAEPLQNKVLTEPEEEKVVEDSEIEKVHSTVQPPLIMVTGVSTEAHLNKLSLARKLDEKEMRRKSDSSSDSESKSSDDEHAATYIASADSKDASLKEQDTLSQNISVTEESNSADSSEGKSIKPASFETMKDAPATASLTAPGKVDQLSRSVNFLSNIDDGKKQDSSASDRDTLRKSTPNLASIKTRPSLGSSWSVYSTAAKMKGDFEISGTIKFSLHYSYKSGTLNIHIGSCSDLAAAEKKKLSNPYVKLYLLPDKYTKKKTKAKKKTIHPVYNEIFKYAISESELKTRTLNISVWHDKLGANVFLGEVNIILDAFDISAPAAMKTYALQPKEEVTVDEFKVYLGEIELALRLTTNKPLSDEGQLEIVVKNVSNIPTKAVSTELYVKCYLLPDKARTTKQKTPVVTGKVRFDFDHLFTYTNVHISELEQRCIELTVCEPGRLGNHVLGGVRIGPGTGMSFDKSVLWMDSTREESSLWRSAVQNPSHWVERKLGLRYFEPSK